MKINSSIVISKLDSVAFIYRDIICHELVVDEKGRSVWTYVTKTVIQVECLGRKLQFLEPIKKPSTIGNNKTYPMWDIVEGEIEFVTFGFSVF